MEPLLGGVLLALLTVAHDPGILGLRAALTFAALTFAAFVLDILQFACGVVRLAGRPACFLRFAWLAGSQRLRERARTFPAAVDWR